MLQQDFNDILSSLDAEGAEYLVVGAYALAAHGFPRATGDLDVWVASSRANAERVWRALVKFGAPLDRLSVDDLTRPDTVFQIGLPPRRVDILTTIDAVAFPEAWDKRVIVRVGTRDVPILSREHLIQNKRAVGRPRDLADVASLEQDSGK